MYHRNGVGNNNTNFSDNLARTLNTKWPNVQQVKFTTPYRSSFVIDVAYARLRDDDRFDPRPEVSNGAISRFDSLTNTFTEAWPTYNFNLHKRDQAHASISYFTGKHDIRAGYSIFVNGKPSAIWSTSAMRADYRNGQPDLVRTYNVAIYDPATARDVEPLFTQGNREQGYYIQDKWTPTRKLVVNVGVRFESNYGWQDATCQPVTVFFTTGRCFDAIKGAPDLKNVLPRFAVVYDLRGDGRTALKFAANRYDQPIQMEFVGRLNPVGATSDQRQWLPQSQCNDPGVLGCDRNGDLIPQINELGPSGGFAARDDVALCRRPEVSGLERVQRRGPASASRQHGAVGRVHASQTRRNLGQRNMARSRGHLHRHQHHRADQRPRGHRLQPEPCAARPERHAVGQRGSAGYELQRRGYHGQQADERWLVADGRRELRQEHRRRARRRPEQSELEGVPQGSARQRRAVVVPAVGGVRPAVSDRLDERHACSTYKGVPESTTVSIGSGAVPGGLTQVTQSLVVEPRGDVRLPNVFSLDISLQKAMRLRATKSFEPQAGFLQSHQRSHGDELAADARIDVSPRKHDSGREDDQGRV